MKVFYTWILS